MNIALHIVTITMKRIPMATATKWAKIIEGEFSLHLLVIGVKLRFCRRLEVSRFAR